MFSVVSVVLFTGRVPTFQCPSSPNPCTGPWSTHCPPPRLVQLGPHCINRHIPNLFIMKLAAFGILEFLSFTRDSLSHVLCNRNINVQTLRKTRQQNFLLTCAKFKEIVEEKLFFTKQVIMFKPNCSQASSFQCCIYRTKSICV